MQSFQNKYCDFYCFETLRFKQRPENETYIDQSVRNEKYSYLHFHFKKLDFFVIYTNDVWENNFEYEIVVLAL